MRKVCALCLNEKELRNSHIIPRFMQKRALGGKDTMMFVAGEKQPRRVPPDPTEKLLCGDCEQRFGRWEGAAARFFYRKRVALLHRLKRTSVVQFGAYATMKLFLMSMLWRLDVTSLPIFSPRNVLGPHRERLRKMLLSDNPGEPWRYGCVLAIPTFNGEPIEDTLIPLVPAKLMESRVQWFVAAGIYFQFFVTNHPPAGLPPMLAIDLSGRFVIARREVQDIHTLYQLIADFPFDDAS